MSIFDLNRHDLSAILVGQPAYRSKQVWVGLYNNLEFPWEQTNLPKSLRTELQNHPQANVALVEAEAHFADEMTTLKRMYELSDGNQIETVLMKYDHRTTLCVSSQAGCAMGCVFCATGQAGYFRNLTQGEILEQTFHGARTSRDLFNRRLSNIVFMGMGEPMSNYDNVISAIQRISFDFGISARNITVSTVGIVPGIKRLADQSLPISLAISLHSANNSKRSSLVPINNTYPIEELVESIKYFQSRSTRRVSFEWAMMADINDTSDDIEELANIANQVSAHVNLIPLNPTPGFKTVGSSPDRVFQFRNELAKLGVNATIRRNRGNQIAGACGQLVTQVSSKSRKPIGNLTIKTS